MKIRVRDLRALVREALVDQMREVPGPNSRDDAEDRALDEAVDPALVADLDQALQGLQAVLKSIEAAHQKAADPKSKVVLAGVHSDLFNSGAYLRKVKSGNPG